MRIIGVDYGLTRTGLAIWDSQADLVLPLEILVEKDIDKLVRKISDICSEEQADLIVVGDPKLLSGDDFGKQVKATDDFVELLKKQTKIIIEREDERMSSGVAKRQQNQAGSNQTAGRDALAAAAILESYIDIHGVIED